MACVVCQHCQGKVFKDDVIAVRDGYSYHEKCHKCYVCSETNLHKAEVFKGVIFCYSCSQRIFQGCSTAKRTKENNKGRRTRPKRRDWSRRRHQERRIKRKRHTEGVLELTRFAGCTDTDTATGSTCSDKKKPTLSDTLAASTDLTFLMKNIKEMSTSKSLKKESIEIGMTTDVTQELLRQMNCPVVTERKHRKRAVSPKTRPIEKGDNNFNKTIICSDLRIAELGASTEIGHMALRKRSEVPVMIKSETAMRVKDSSTMSDVTDDENGDWLDSNYSSKDVSKPCWLDRRIGSILKMPYKLFKKNILDRSSLIMVAENDVESKVFLKQVKKLFHEEIAEHQHRGVKRLYSTINRRKIPYKMGWLNIRQSVKCLRQSGESNKPELALNCTTSKMKPPRCKHFRTHSYRCMRAQVMRLAGPTKSELATFRNNFKKKVTPKFVKHIINFNKKYSAIMMSQACGSEVHGYTQRQK